MNEKEGDHKGRPYVTTRSLNADDDVSWHPRRWPTIPCGTMCGIRRSPLSPAMCMGRRWLRPVVLLPVA